MTSITRAPPGANDVAVRAELVRALFASIAVPLMNVVIVAITAALLWPIYPARIVVAWTGASIAVALFRLALWLRFKRRQQDGGDLASWAFAFTLASAAMGCLWGLLASTVFVTPDPVYTVFAAFVLGGMSAGAATHSSPHLPAYYGFAVPAVLPMVVALLTQGAGMPIGMGLMLLAFVAVLTVVARDNNRRLVEYIRMKIEQGALNDELQKLTRELEKRSATDSLTGAWNRAYLDRVTASELDRSIRFQQPVSLIMLDIDHFKADQRYLRSSSRRRRIARTGPGDRRCDSIDRYPVSLGRRGIHRAGDFHRLPGRREAGGNDAQQGGATSFCRSRIGDDQPGRGRAYFNRGRGDLVSPGG